MATADIVNVQHEVRRHLRYSLGRRLEDSSARDLFAALALTVRERVIDRMLATEARYAAADAKRLYYLSIEFLMGRALGDNLINLGLFDVCRDAIQAMGVDLDEVEATEPDPALGNGGLGRLAACFLDSLATMDLPGYGYGINYEFGLFRQEIKNGEQRERPDHWLKDGTPWLISRPDEACVIPVYGRIEHGVDARGDYHPRWLDWKILIGVPHDMPIVGHGGRTVNVLRLFSARAAPEFDVQIGTARDYIQAVEQLIASETVSKVLYPSDSSDTGRELRLIQEYFLVACALRDIVTRHRRHHERWDELPHKVAIQLNDTHPALAVAELMRILVDENAVPWERAWCLTQATLGYTSHSTLPEALEKWPVPLMEAVLPRHLQLIYEINHRFLKHVRALWPGDGERARRMSIIEEGEPRQVRMAHLAVAGSHSVNGVAALHSRLIQTRLLPDFHALWPERFNNKTNGITQRRWLLRANPPLARLIGAAIGDAWITDLRHLAALRRHAADAPFQAEFRGVKRANKSRLAAAIRDTVRVPVDPDSLFDVQVKRIHEHKRQLLNALHIIRQYLRLADGGPPLTAPKIYVFAGKAAPGYSMPKLVIRLINAIGEAINSEARIRDQLRVVFMPDYRVSLAELIIPAADLSEQISTAGREASGTGSMKLALNGALTIGTLDGATVEIREEVGADNMYVFGLTADEVARLLRSGAYDPWGYCARNPELRAVVETLRTDRFCKGQPGLFRPLYDRLMSAADEYVHLADFGEYAAAHERAAEEFGQPALWAHKAILNVAGMGKFSSDRTIGEYAKDIWGLAPIGG